MVVGVVLTGEADAVRAAAARRAGAQRELRGHARPRRLLALRAGAARRRTACGPHRAHHTLVPEPLLTTTVLVKLRPAFNICATRDLRNDF